MKAANHWKFICSDTTVTVSAPDYHLAIERAANTLAKRWGGSRHSFFDLQLAEASHKTRIRRKPIPY